MDALSGGSPAAVSDNAGADSHGACRRPAALYAWSGSGAQGTSNSLSSFNSSLGSTGLLRRCRCLSPSAPGSTLQVSPLIRTALKSDPRTCPARRR